MKWTAKLIGNVMILRKCMCVVGYFIRNFVCIPYYSIDISILNRMLVLIKTFHNQNNV